MSGDGYLSGNLLLFEVVEFVVEFLDTFDDLLDEEILAHIIWEGSEFADGPVSDED